MTGDIRGNALDGLPWTLGAPEVVESADGETPQGSKAPPAEDVPAIDHEVPVIPSGDD